MNDYLKFINRIFRDNRTAWWANLAGEVRQGRSGRLYLQEALEKELTDYPGYRNTDRRLFFFSSSAMSSIDGQYGHLGVEEKCNPLEFSNKLIDGAIHRGFIWVVGNPQSISKNDLHSLSLYVVTSDTEPLSQDITNIIIPVLKVVEKIGIHVIFIDGNSGDRWKVAADFETQTAIPRWFSVSNKPREWDLSLEEISDDMRNALHEVSRRPDLFSSNNNPIECIPGFSSRVGTFQVVAARQGRKVAIMQYGNEWRIIELGLILRAMGYDAAIVRYDRTMHKDGRRKKALSLAGRGVEKRVYDFMLNRFNVRLDWGIEVDQESAKD